MEIYTKLQAELKRQRDAGLTNKEIAAMVGDISHAHINRLLNGSVEQFGSLKFSTVLRMFPFVRRLLDGDTASISIANSPSAAAAINGVAEAGAMGAVAEIMAIDMCDGCKVKAANIVIGRWAKK